MKIYWRFVFAWMGFCGLTIVCMQRVNLSVAIVDMVNSTMFKPKNYTPECPVSTKNNSVIEKIGSGEFMWSEGEQTMLLSSFYWGYTLVQIPSGILLLFFKPKWIYGLSTLMTSIFTLFFPLAAKGGIYPIVILRFLMGVCEGPTYPSLFALCACWMLPKESTIVATFITAGGSIGTIVGQSLTGILIQQLGWRWMFYIMSIFGFIWFLIYGFVVYDRPCDHPFISQYEKQLLEDSLPHNQSSYKPKRVPVPWKKVFTSGPFYSFLILGSSFSFTWFTMVSCLPLYIGTVLGFNISENGGISSLPYIALFIFSLVGGVSQNFIISKDIISLTKIRKIFAFSGIALGSFIMYGIIFTGCNVPLTISLLCLSMAVLGLPSSVIAVNLIDIAPAYAGPLLAISNFFVSLCGIIAPYVKGYYTFYGETRQNWSNVFITSSSILFFSAVVFLVFGSATLQPWAILDCDLEYLVSCDDQPETKYTINDSR